MIEREAPGGQAGQSPRIENYLGFHAGLSGSELSRRAIIQARRFGAELVRPSEVIGIESAGGKVALHLSDQTKVTADRALIATGVSYRRLTAAGVSELIGRGIYYGASARDARERTDQHVFIVGGANSAGQSALDFARYARKVTILIRADSLAKDEPIPGRSDRGGGQHRGAHLHRARRGARERAPGVPFSRA